MAPPRSLKSTSKHGGLYQHPWKATHFDDAKTLSNIPMNEIVMQLGYCLAHDPRAPCREDLPWL
jgi:hypothetical protein